MNCLQNIVETLLYKVYNVIFYPSIAQMFLHNTEQIKIISY